MKLFVENDDGRLKIGLNLIMSSYEDEIPDVLDVTDSVNRTIYWKVDGNFIHLSVFANWRFIRLNEAFRANWQVNDRVLYMFPMR